MQPILSKNFGIHILHIKSNQKNTQKDGNSDRHFHFSKPKTRKFSLISGFLHNQTGIEEAFSLSKTENSSMQKHSVEP